MSTVRFERLASALSLRSRALVLGLGSPRALPSPRGWLGPGRRRDSGHWLVRPVASVRKVSTRQRRQGTRKCTIQHHLCHFQTQAAVIKPSIEFARRKKPVNILTNNKWQENGGFSIGITAESACKTFQQGSVDHDCHPPTRKLSSTRGNRSPSRTHVDGMSRACDGPGARACGACGAIVRILLGYGRLSTCCCSRLSDSSRPARGMGREGVKGGSCLWPKSRA
jgi:hypothetical protein